jgi:PAS domain S-box-containing protein
MLPETRIWWSHAIRSIVVFLAITFCAVGWYKTRSAKFESDAEVAALEAREDALSSLLYGTNYGYAVLDWKGRVMLWNPALEKWTGYSQADLLGKNLLALMPAEKQKLHADGYEKVINDPNAAGKTFQVFCELVPRTTGSEPIRVQVNIRVLRPKNGSGHPCAVAMVDRVRSMVRLSPEPPTAAN